MVDDLALFDDTALKCCKIINHQYTSIFADAIESLDKRLRMPIYGLYGFLRLADEVVDTFHHKDKRLLLTELKKEVFEAIDTGISLNPVLHGFQLVVNKYKIDLSLIDTFLHSMEMDLDVKTYDNARFDEYVKGSAEAVGLMFLHVFCEGDLSAFERAREYACKMVNVFQKVNFLRDLNSDYENCGRVYFPGVDLKKFNISAKQLIENDIEKDFEHSKLGIKLFPAGSKRFIKIAFLYNRKLFDRIKALTPEKILQEKIKISNFEKRCIVLMNNDYLYVCLVLFTIVCLLASCLVPEFQLSYKWHALLPAFFIIAAFFISIARTGI